MTEVGCGLRCATGETAWEVTRPVPNSWATPIVMQAADWQQLITCGSPWVITYDPATGTELGAPGPWGCGSVADLRLRPRDRGQRER